MFGRPLDEITPKLGEIQAAMEETGVEIGAVGRWASHILDENGEVIEAEWSEVKKVIDFGSALGAKHYLCSVAYVPQLSYYKNITAAIKVLNQIVAYAKERGMQCAIVNCMMGGNYIRTPEQWKLVLDEVPGLGIKYDPSHSFVHGGDKGAYLEEKPRLGRPLPVLPCQGRHSGRRIERAGALETARDHLPSPGARRRIQGRVRGGRPLVRQPAGRHRFDQLARVLLDPLQVRLRRLPRNRAAFGDVAGRKGRKGRQVHDQVYPRSDAVSLVCPLSALCGEPKMK
ncbi:MAG: sugar phosphate isomerase/epimerase family protein [Christensenellales bacterium]